MATKSNCIGERSSVIQTIVRFFIGWAAGSFIAAAIVFVFDIQSVTICATLGFLLGICGVGFFVLVLDRDFQ